MTSIPTPKASRARRSVTARAAGSLGALGSTLAVAPVVAHPQRALPVLGAVGAALLIAGLRLRDRHLGAGLLGALVGFVAGLALWCALVAGAFLLLRNVQFG